MRHNRPDFTMGVRIDIDALFREIPPNRLTYYSSTKLPRMDWTGIAPRYVALIFT